MDIVEWLNMKSEGFYNLTTKDRLEEAATEINRLREALRAINRKNDNPAWFNPDIHEILEVALQQKENE